MVKTALQITECQHWQSHIITTKAHIVNQNFKNCTKDCYFIIYIHSTIILKTEPHFRAPSWTSLDNNIWIHVMLNLMYNVTAVPFRMVTSVTECKPDGWENKVYLEVAFRNNVHFVCQNSAQKCSKAVVARAKCSKAVVARANYETSRCLSGGLTILSFGKGKIIYHHTRNVLLLWSSYHYRLP